MPNETLEATYVSVGTDEPTVVRVVGVPAGWSVKVDLENHKFIIKSPATITADNCGGIATVLVGTGSQLAGMYDLDLSKCLEGNESQSKYYENGELVGWVYRVKTDEQKGLILHKDYISLWSVSDQLALGELSAENLDGETFFSQLKEKWPNWSSISFWKYADSLGDGWFIPTSTDVNSMTARFFQFWGDWSYRSLLGVDSVAVTFEDDAYTLSCHTSFDFGNSENGLSRKGNTVLALVLPESTSESFGNNKALGCMRHF